MNASDKNTKGEENVTVRKGKGFNTVKGSNTHKWGAPNTLSCKNTGNDIFITIGTPPPPSPKGPNL